MASKLLNLIALSTIAILASSFGAIPVSALSVISPNHHARSLVNHGVIMKKRADAGSPKCKPRPSGSAAPPTGQQPPAPSPAPTPPPPPPPSTPVGGGKGLLAWGAGPRPDIFYKFKSLGISTYYNWSPYPVDGAAEAGYDFCPMLWGTKDLDSFRAIKPGQYKCVMGFNEPDHGGQAAIDPYYAGQLWKDIMLPLRAGGTRLISPAVTNADSGFDWFAKFISSCGGNVDACGIDAVAVHVYATDINYVKTHITKWHDIYGKNVWLTEFADTDFAGGAQPSIDQIYAWAGQLADFLKNTPWIEKYSPFIIADNLGNVVDGNRIINPDGGPNDLAYKYYA